MADSFIKVKAISASEASSSTKESKSIAKPFIESAETAIKSS
jgi:hypothetical protein